MNLFSNWGKRNVNLTKEIYEQKTHILIVSYGFCHFIRMRH